MIPFESLTDANELELADRRSRESIFHGIVARHVMSPLDAFLKENDSIGRAADVLFRRHTSSMPVLDAAGRLAGVVSEKELVGRDGLAGLLAAAGQQHDEAQRHLL